VGAPPDLSWVRSGETQLSWCCFGPRVGACGLIIPSICYNTAQQALIFVPSCFISIAQSSRVGAGRPALLCELSFHSVEGFSFPLPHRLPPVLRGLPAWLKALPHLIRHPENSAVPRVEGAPSDPPGGEDLPRGAEQRRGCAHEEGRFSSGRNLGKCPLSHGSENAIIVGDAPHPRLSSVCPPPAEHRRAAARRGAAVAQQSRHQPRRGRLRSPGGFRSRLQTPSAQERLTSLNRKPRTAPGAALGQRAL